ncbi:hypothetical protein ACLKA6_015472 [Drosophila palustris]
MNACCDQGGDSSERNLEASQFLQAYQESTSVWDISDWMLWKMDQGEDVLVLAVVTLRHRIRNYLNELSPLQHSALFRRLVTYSKCANKNGMQQLVGYLSVSIADLLLRLRWRMMIDLCVNNLFKKAPPVFFQVLEVMPVEAVHFNETQHLKTETKGLLDCLNWLQDRDEVDGTRLHRACFLICASWTRTHFLSIDNLMNHKVIENAFQVMNEPKLFDGEISKEASECLCALLEHVAHARKNLSINWNLEDKIYKSCSAIKLPILQNEIKQMKATAGLYIQVTETYACLDAVHTPSELLDRGPNCYELLLQVATHCDLDIILSSMPLWHKLFDQIPFQFEKALCETYCSIVVSALNIFYKKCRLPEDRMQPGSHASDTMTELRNHVKDLLYNVSDLEGIMNLKSFTRKMIETAFGLENAWDDIEASFFFLTAVIPKLLRQDKELIIELIKILPNRAFDYKSHPAVCQQVIILNTECHKCFDDPLQRHQFVEQMIDFGFHLESGLHDRDTLEVIIKSCHILDKCRHKDLIAFENGLLWLEDKLSKIPGESMH